MNSDLILIRNYTSDIEAKMAKMLLEENGIDAMIHKDDSGSMRPHFQKILGVQLFVRKNEIEQAEEILQSIDNYNGNN